MKIVLGLIISIFSVCALGAELKMNIADAKKSNKITKEDLIVDGDSFYDPKFDYMNFSGRVTDRDQSGTIVKITSENKNVKFFRASDLVEFKIQNTEKTNYCQGYVRSIEDNYFVVFVKDFHPCFAGDDYFRRGTVLIMRSEKLLLRVKEATIYRASLIKKKKDYMSQLNNVNQDIFSYEEKKVQIASEFDQKIADLETQKIKSLDKLITEKNDEIRLQRELGYRLDSIEKELVFYRLEKQELMVDRWHLDHDLGYPVYKRPEEIRAERSPSTNNN
jgi:hypothetical protein